jgi:Flp pilus assembly pilin Flp
MVPFITALIGLYAPAGEVARTRAGQSLVEYALVIILVAIAAMAAIAAMGGQLQTVFNRISASLTVP